MKNDPKYEITIRKIEKRSKPKAEVKVQLLLSDGADIAKILYLGIIVVLFKISRVLLPIHLQIPSTHRSGDEMLTHYM